MKDGSFHVLIYTFIFFSLGMFKPQWPLFFMKQPTRFIILVISTVGFMIGTTMYGQAMHEEKLTQKLAESAQIASPVNEVPTVK